MDPSSMNRMKQDVIDALPILTSLLDKDSQKPILSLPSVETVTSFQQIALPSGPRPIEDVIKEATSIFTHRMAMNHPKSFAFIPAPVSPLTLLGDTLISLYNAHAGSWFQSSGPSAIENALLNFLASKIGMPEETAGGVFVSGGSMANLTALCVARDQMLGCDLEKRGKGTVYLSAQTHLSIAKGLKVLGFLDSQIRKVDVDSTFRMDIKSLKKAVQADRAAGHFPFAVVASCGTTNTGSTDPLHAIADFAKEEKMWMHVDGAYGASIVLSKSYVHLADGLGRADSVSWDAHKWLFQTYGCGIVLVQNKRHLMDSFATDAEYVRDAVAAEESPNFWNFGIELTRPARAMKLWFTMRVLGLERLGEMIDHGFMLVERAEEELRLLGEYWEILSPARLAVIVFRFAPPGKSEEELDELNIAVSKRMLEENIAGVLTTKLTGKTVLRICAISPELGLDEMAEIVKKMDETAKSVL